MGTILDDIARGYGRSALTWVIATAIMVPMTCGLICLPMWAYTQYDLGVWALVIPAALFLLLLFGGGGFYGWWVVSRRNKMLEAAFGALGLTGKAYQSFFRCFHGQARGREAAVYLSRGPRLEIEIGTHLQTRLGAAGPHPDTRFLAGLAGKEPMQLEDPALGALTLFPHDEAWARRLLADPRAAALLVRLITPTGGFSRQQVLLRPGAFQLLLTGNTNLWRFEIEPDQANAWLNDLLSLVELAERLPAPTITSERSSLELAALRLRGRNPYLALWVGLGTLVFILVTALCVMGVVAVVGG